MDARLKASFRYAKHVTRKASSTFYLASWLFTAEDRRDLSAIYAFCRVADDIADAPGLSLQERENELDLLTHVLKMERYSEDDLLWPAFFDVVKRHHIDKRYFLDLLAGVRSDIEPFEVCDIKDLEHYSYLVAGTVGLMCASVLGATRSKTLEGAKQLGIAMQITNIMRDVSADAAIGRIYVPTQLLKRHDLTAREVMAGIYDERSVALLGELADRAQKYYEQAELAIADLKPSKRRPVRVALRLYRSILERIEQKNFNVYNKRIRLNALQKLLIVVSTR